MIEANAIRLMFATCLCALCSISCLLGAYLVYRSNFKEGIPLMTASIILVRRAYNEAEESETELKNSATLSKPELAEMNVILDTVDLENHQFENSNPSETQQQNSR